MTTANPYSSGAEHHGLAPYQGPAAPGATAAPGVIESPYCSYDYMRQNGALYHHQFPPQQQHHHFDPYQRSAYRDTSMKQEPHDDGYETSGDLEIRAQGDAAAAAGQKLYNPMQASLNIKQEPAPHDPYSFVDEDAAAASQQARGVCPPGIPNPVMPMPKKRGRKKKLKPGEEGMTEDGLMEGEPAMKKKIKEEKPLKERKKHDRFNGMPEEEVSKRTLPDHLTSNLDIVIIGINPGLFAAYKGHHYAGPGNHFWKCMYLSGITPEPMTADDDYKMLKHGVGFTNMVCRATKGSADLTRKEIKEGCYLLTEKLKKYKPKIAVFNGKLIYEVFSGKKDFPFGKQTDFVDGTNTYIWVMPSSSARCAQLPRAADKVPFYAALKKFRDYLNGIISELDDSEVVFNDPKLRNITENGETKEESKEGFYGYGRLPSNGDLTDLSNAVRKDGAVIDPSAPPKKKRGRPKKIKGDEDANAPPPKPRPPKPPPTVLPNGEIPKKKRGRPKKIKDGDLQQQAQVQQVQQQQQQAQQMQQQQQHNGMVMGNCFSPPPNSFLPNQFNQYNQPMYQQPPPQQQQQQPSPNSAQYHQHQSPPVAHRFASQSPRPSSQQPFTHSDLSSEISAAISSEHNLGSPPPTSPSLGPPDFEPPTSMPEEGKEQPQEQPAVNNVPFSSPTPPSSNSASQDLQTQLPPQQQQSYQGQGYPVNTSAPTPQDMASKSLSGLESLVDQIPSITDQGPGGNPEAPSAGGGGAFEPVGGYDEQAAAAGYNPYNPATYPAYSAASANYNSFSVSSLANSSATGAPTAPPSNMSPGAAGGDLNSPFSVSSLAAPNYNPHHHHHQHPAATAANPNGYANLMGGHAHMMGNQGMFGGPPMPYPYGQYPAAASGYPYTPSAIHMPSPNYPYPYNNNPYHPHQPAASGYLQNHMLDRIKQDRMDIGFGGF